MCKFELETNSCRCCKHLRCSTKKAIIILSCVVAVLGIYSVVATLWLIFDLIHRKFMYEVIYGNGLLKQAKEDFPKRAIEVSNALPLPDHYVTSNFQNLPNVVIVVSTYWKRRKFDQHIYNSFQFQTYPAEKLKLLIIEQSEPSDAKASLFENMTDARVRFTRWTCDNPKPFEGMLGFKRNYGIDFVRLHQDFFGNDPIIISFDDDDFYGPEYVSTVVNQYIEHPNASLVKISHWLFATRKESKSEMSRYQPPMKRNGAYSYGFSFSYRASIQARYGTRRNLGEDTVLVGEVRRLGNEVVLIQDSTDPDKTILLKRLDKRNEALSTVDCSGDCRGYDVNDFYKLFQKQCQKLNTNLKSNCMNYYKKELRDFLG